MRYSGTKQSRSEIAKETRQCAGASGNGFQDEQEERDLTKRVTILAKTYTVRVSEPREAVFDLRICEMKAANHKESSNIIGDVPI